MRYLLLAALLAAGLSCKDEDPAGSMDSAVQAPDAASAPDKGAVTQKDTGAGSPDHAAAPDVTPPDLAPAADAPLAAINVLFVGNSYTQGNNLPKLVAGLATASGKAPKITVDSVLAGGATLQMHFQSTGAVAKLNKGGFTHAVFQGQSYEALIAPTNFGTYAKKLADEAKKNKTAQVWFETWARVAGHSDYKKSWSGGTPAAMQKGLRLAYSSVAKATGGIMAPVGDAWEASLKAHPTIKLHEGDGSHARITGSYLAACVFYAVLTGHSPVGIGGVPAGVSAADAAKLSKIAWQTVKAMKP